MPNSSPPMSRLEQQRSRALAAVFTDPKTMHAALMAFVGQRLTEQMLVQALLFMSRQVSNLAQLPCPHTPSFVTNGLGQRSLQIMSLEIEKLFRMYSIVSSLESGDDQSSGMLRAKQFLMSALLRARTFSALSSRVMKQVVREVRRARMNPSVLYALPHVCGRLSSLKCSCGTLRRSPVSLCVASGNRD